MDELHRAYDLGLFPTSERYELLEGRLFRQMPRKNPHIVATALMREALRAVFGPGFCLWDHSPINATPGTHPEPDVMVLPGDLRDWDGRDPAPGDVVLAVEVSDTTLREDRGYKAALYARLGLAELWIVDLAGRRVEVRRGPLPDGAWSLTGVYGEADALPTPGRDALIPVADVLPRAAPFAPSEPL